MVAGRDELKGVLMFEPVPLPRFFDSRLPFVCGMAMR